MPKRGGGMGHDQIGSGWLYNDTAVNSISGGCGSHPGRLAVMPRLTWNFSVKRLKGRRGRLGRGKRGGKGEANGKEGEGEGRG